MLLRHHFILVFFCFTGLLFARDATQPWSARMAESVMDRHPNVYSNWDYVTGTVLRGFQEMWRATGDDKYLQYIQSTVDNVVNQNGSISGYSLSSYNLDEINEGRMVLFLYSRTGLEKYKTAADLLRRQLDGQPRTNSGGFWHKQIYPWQMWQDGLYMASPFYAEFNMLFNHPEDFDDVVLQLTEMEKHARDSATGLIYHGWDESKTQAWADPVTGCSPSFWGRAIGWYAMALVDVLDFLPVQHSKRDSVIAIIDRLADAMFAVQDDSSGVWWQVVDQGKRDGNYLEASVSCMMVYSTAKAVRMGYLDDSYLPKIEKAYQGILKEFIRENTDGTINLIQTCSGAGLGGNPYRDGSYDYYVYQTSTRVNDGKGVGPFITASLEMERIGQPDNLKAKAMSGSEIQLQWQLHSNDFEGIKVQRSDGSGFTDIADLAADDSVFTDSGLSSLTNYQYRIRTYNGTQYNPFSEIVEQTTLAENGAPSYAVQPDPADKSTNQSSGLILSWESGQGVQSHDIYFGESNPPSFVTNQTANNFAPGALKNSTTYYWRIDEVNDKGTTEGYLWSFSTGQDLEEQKLVAYWPLDASSGTTARDSIYNNDGSLVNMDDSAWQAGISGGALFFDGVDDYVQIAHDPVFDFSTQSFTVSFWLKQNARDAAMRYLIKGTHGTPGTGKRFEIFHHQSNTVRFSIDDNVVKSVVEVPDTFFVKNDWVQLTAVRNTGTQQMMLYANGKLVGSTADNTGDISQNEDLYFGVSPDPFDSYFQGGLDDIRLYDYALSDSAIEGLYTQNVTAINRVKKNQVPQELFLYAYPNPFNAETRIVYSVKQGGRIFLRLYNSNGQVVRNLVDNVRSPGRYEVRLDASDLASGIYFCQFETNSKTIVRKILLLK